jgi:hypothetical protein
LKAAAGAAGTWVIAAELFAQFFVAVNDAIASSDVRLGRESFAALTD